MEGSKQELFLPIISIVKVEEGLEMRDLENHNFSQDETCTTFHIKQEEDHTYMYQLSVPSEEFTEKFKVDMIPEDPTVKLETEHKLDKNTKACEDKFKYDVKEDMKLIKSENECDGITSQHDSQKSESVLVSNVVVRDPLSWNSKEEARYCAKEYSLNDAFLPVVNKEESSESFFRQSEPDLFTTMSKEITRPEKGNKRRVFQNGKVLIGNMQCKNEKDTMCNERQPNTKHLEPYLLYESRGNYMCDICKKFLSNKKTLKVHMSTHSNREKIFVCDNCSKHFNSKMNIRKHMYMHRNIKYSCKICSETYNKWSTYRYHTALHLRKFVCNICKKCLSCKASLAVHMLNHNDVRFTCDICCKSFSSRSGVQRHIKGHAKEEYICEICRKCFTTKAYIYLHMQQAHQQYSCQVCFKTYNNRSSYRSHLLLHTVGSYICDICNKSFLIKTSLYGHMLVHLGIKRKMRKKIFHCNICNKSFSQLCNVEKHILSVHSNTRLM